MNILEAEKHMACLLADEAQTIAFGAVLARALDALEPRCSSTVIYLHGGLGAGKTTLCRGLVQACGHRGAVKSPTFTLVEPYQLPVRSVYHFDLFRLTAADEFDYIGVDNYFDEPGAVCLVEWPERASGVLPAADLAIALCDGETMANENAADGETLQRPAMRNTEAPDASLPGMTIRNPASESAQNLRAENFAAQLTTRQLLVSARSAHGKALLEALVTCAAQSGVVGLAAMPGQSTE
ncbi:MAG: tRNA (adenosine(37)-N6)-threonylcarbamoyltransferase complex ATPase subunit type 1 TsaE [Pseudomonadales bacterium]